MDLSVDENSLPLLRGNILMSPRESTEVLEAHEETVNNEIPPGSPILDSQKKSQNNFDYDINDPGTWPSKLSDADRHYIIRMRRDSDYTPNLCKSHRDGRTLTKDWFLNN